MFFIFLIPYQTSSITQTYGISPRLFPYFLGYLILISGLILLVDCLKNKRSYKEVKIKIFSKNENLRLLYYLVVLSLLPVLMEFLGFFTGIIIILLSLLLLSGLRNKMMIINTIVITVLLVYVLFFFLKFHLPQGILF